MSTYQLIPAGTFALGWLSAALLFRERLLRLSADRNLHAYRADEQRRERHRAEAERDQLAATLATKTDGGHYQPLSLEAAMQAHPAGKGVIRFPRQGQR